MMGDMQTDTGGAALENARKVALWGNVVVVVAIAGVLGAGGRSSSYGQFSTELTALSAQIVSWNLQGLGVLANVVAAHSLLASPVFLMVGALWELGGALREYEKGRFFSRKSARSVRNAGLWALIAVAMKASAPTLFLIMIGEPLRARIGAESFDVALFAFAVFLVLIGHVLEAAIAIKAENDEIV